MRVLLIHNSEAFGGAERYTVDLASGLLATGHEVVFAGPASSPTGRRLARVGAAIAHVPMGMAIGWHAPLGPLNEMLFRVDLHVNPRRRRLESTVRAVHAEKPVDVIHVQFIKERLWAGALGRELGVPVVWTVHAPREEWMTRGCAASVFDAEASRVARIIAVSRATAADLVDAGVPAPRIDVIYNGVDMLAYAAGERAATRTRLEIGDAFLVLVPARPYAEKGIDVLLQATRGLIAGEVSRGDRRVQVLVAGDSRHRSSYETLAARLGLGERVWFLGHRDDMPDLYAASDVVCLPSFREGLPYALSEAMAAGRPVVATDVGGVAEMVVDGETGLIVPAGDVSALADAIRLLQDTALRQRMGDAAETRARQLFSMESMISHTAAAYEQAIATAAEGHPDA